MNTTDIDMKVNQLPSLTWNFLNINNADVRQKVQLNRRASKIIQNIPNGVIVGNSGCEGCDKCNICEGRNIKDVKTGMGMEADKFFESNKPDTLVIRAKRGVEVREPLCLNYLLRDDDGDIVRQEIIAEEGSSLTVIMDYSSGKHEGGFFGVQTRLHAGKGSVIHLVKIELLGDRFLHFDDIGAEADEGGKIDIIQM